MITKPTLDEIRNQYLDYKTVPVSTALEAEITAVEVLKKLKKVSSHCYVLESAEDVQETGRYTFLGFDPKAEISCKDYDVTVIDQYGVKKAHANPKPYIKQILEENRSPKLSYLPNFTGGLVGYFSYDYIRYSEPGLNLDAVDDGSFKDVDLMLFDKVIAFDNFRQKIILIVNISLADAESAMLEASFAPVRRCLLITLL